METMKPTGINKILFCNLVPRKRGSFEAFLLALGDVVEGHKGRLCVVFGGQPDSWFSGELTKRGVQWRVLEGWTDAGDREHGWRFCFGALRFIREIRPDVVSVHFGNEFPTILAVVICRLLLPGKIHWLWLQNQRIADPSWLTRIVSRIRILSWFIDKFAAVYEGGRRSMLLRGIPSDKVVVIRNGIGEPARSLECGWLRRFVGASDRDVIAVSVNSLIPRKRVWFQIEALAALVNRGLNVRLIVVGDGPELSELEARSRKLGVHSIVHFLGLRNDVMDILFESDISLLSSTAEANAYSTIESMAAGIPAIVTDAGAAREQVEEGRSGYVVGMDDLHGFTLCWARLVSDPDLRRQMGREARLKWMREYRLEDAVQLYHECCVELTGRDEGVKGLK